MQCPKCQHENRPSAKFCGACANTLIENILCPACGGTNQPGQKFCDECGVALAVAASGPGSPQAPLPALAPPIVERRQLTVLYCDLVGSTALAQQLDPEDLREVIRDYQSLVTAVVERYEGYLAQYLGDGVLIYFGYPNAHENDAERAVHTGLAIVATMTASDDRWRKRLGAPLEVRVGIHTGLVLVDDLGGSARTERLAVGDAPNMAARLQGLAPPGGVVISTGTQRLISGLFTCESLGEQIIKGVAESLHAWRVLASRAASNRFDAIAEIHLTPLVGRAQEIGLLADRWQSAQDGDGQVVFVSGEPGLGKSRLVHELRQTLGDTVPTVLRFQCSPFYVNSAWYPLTEHLERALALPSEATSDTKLEALEALVVQRFRLPLLYAQLLAGMLSISTGARYPKLTITPQRQKEDAIKAAVALTLATAEFGALVLFEDAHWADPSTLEFLDLLIDRVSNVRLLMILTHRPEFKSRWATHGHVASLALSRLNRTQSGGIVTRLTGGRLLPSGLLEQIIAKTDGVPLFVEEMTRTLIESGQIRDLGDRYEIATPTGALKVPATLRDSLMARLDRDPLVKDIAQTAAAIGRDFSYRLLKIVASLDVNSLETGLGRLIDSGLAFRRGALDDAVFTFKHALVQDAAYESLVKSRRQALHAAIAAAIEQESPNVKDSEPELLAHHYTAAGMIDTAIPLWQRAGDFALTRVAAQEAISHLTKGLELLAAIPPSRACDELEINLRISLGGAWTMRDGWYAREVWSTIHPALTLAKSLGRNDMLGGIYYSIYANVCTQGRVDEAGQWATEALAAAAQTGDGGLHTIAELLATCSALAAGNWTAAQTHAANLYRVYGTADHRYTLRAIGLDPQDNVDTYAGFWLWSLGLPDQARIAHQAHLSKAKASNHPFMVPYGLTVSAMVYDFRGEPEVLANYAKEAIKFGTDNALPLYSELLGPMLLALAESRLGADAVRIENLRNTIVAWEGVGAYFLTPYMKSALADILMRSGNLSAALEIIEQSIAQIERPGWGERWWLVENLRVKGMVLLSMNDIEGAETLLMRGLNIAREHQAKSWALRAATSLSRLRQLQGRYREAKDQLALICDSFNEGFETKDLRDAKELLDELSLVQDSAHKQSELTG